MINGTRPLQPPSDDAKSGKTTANSAPAAKSSKGAAPASKAVIAPKDQGVMATVKGKASGALDFFKGLVSSEPETPESELRELLEDSSLPAATVKQLSAGGSLSRAELMELYRKLCVSRSSGSRSRRRSDAELMDLCWTLARQSGKPGQRFGLQDLLRGRALRAQQQQCHSHLSAVLAESSVPAALQAKLLNHEPLSQAEARQIYERTSVGRSQGSRDKRRHDAILMDLFWQPSQQSRGALATRNLLDRLYTRTWEGPGPAPLSRPKPEAAEITPEQAAALKALVDGRRDKGSFDGTWRKYRDAGENAFDIGSAEQLRAALGLPADWSGAPRLQALVKALESAGQANAESLSYLARIGSRHGRGQLEAISRVLSEYHASGAGFGGVSKGALLHDALHDLAYPSDIDQSNRGTCGATAIQMKLAIERPLQYVETLVSLAQNKNHQTPGGAMLKPNNSWVGDGGDGRSTSCRIMQNAIMSLAGRGLLWDNGYNSGKDEDEGGLSRGEQTDAIEEIFGDDDYENDGLLSSSSAIFEYVQDDIARGRPVSISFSGHAVLVVGIDKTQTPTRVIMNSWGAQYEMTEAEFKKYVKAARTIDDSGSDSREVAAGTRRILGDR